MILKNDALTADTEAQDAVPPENVSNNTSKDESHRNIADMPVMKNCMIKLYKLTNNDIHYWSNPCATGHYLQQHKPSHQVQPARTVKNIVSYNLDITDTSDDDITVRPGRWLKPRMRNIHLPSSGPSQSCIAAQHRMLEKRELTAAEGLLSLQSTLNGDTGDNDGQESISSSSGNSVSGGSTQSLSSITDPE